MVISPGPNGTSTRGGRIDRRIVLESSPRAPPKKAPPVLDGAMPSRAFSHFRRLLPAPRQGACPHFPMRPSNAVIPFAPADGHVRAPAGWAVALQPCIPMHCRAPPSSARPAGDVRRSNDGPASKAGIDAGDNPLPFAIDGRTVGCRLNSPSFARAALGPENIRTHGPDSKRDPRRRHRPL